MIKNLLALGGLAAVTVTGHAATISLVNGDFSSATIANANDGVKDVDTPAGLDSGWSSGSRGNPWDASTGAAQIAWSNRAEALYQTVSVTSPSGTPTDFTFSFNAAILPDARPSLEGLVEIYTWESSGTTPQIDTESSGIQGVYSAGTAGSATLALSGAATVANAGILFLDNAAFITGDGLVNGNTSGTFSRVFTLPANHNRVAVVFSVENQAGTTIDNTSFGFEVDEVTITPVPEPQIFTLLGVLCGTFLLRRSRR